MRFCNFANANLVKTNFQNVYLGELASLKGHNDIVTSVQISFDNRLIVSGSLDRTAIVWDIETANIIH